MLSGSALRAARAEAEVIRYFGWPGQASAG
jgi:uncharacterized protein (DUF885 family)